MIELPHCAACDRPHWPAREICPHCLGAEIEARHVGGQGSLLAATTLHHSLLPAVRSKLPVNVASAGLDCGVQVIAYLAGEMLPTGARVRLTLVQAVLVASAEAESSC